MLLKEVTLENFKSFKGKHSFSFEDRSPGLHFISGENLAEPALEANGAGKSTLFDAIHWVLYGKTSCSLKASNVRNWDINKTVSVELIFRFNNIDSYLRRTWNPNDLILDGETITQDRIFDLIELSPEAFQSTVLIGQFSTLFFDLPAANKLTLFSSILNLDEWLDKSNASRDQAKQAAVNVQQTRESSEHISGRLTTLRESIKDVEGQSSGYETRKQAALYELSEKLEEAQEENVTTVRSLKILQQESSEQLEPIERLQDEILDLERDNKILQEAANECEKLLVAIDTDLSWTTKSIKRFEEVKEQCPTCEQKVSQEYLDIKIAALSETLLDYANGAKRVEKELSGYEQGIEEANSYISTKNLELSKRKREFAAHQSTFRDMVEDRNISASNIAEIESSIQKITNEENPHDEMLKSLQTQEKTTLKNLQEKRRELITLEADQQAYEFWAKGFKSIRLFLLDDALRNLELEVNNQLSELGLGDWSIFFDVERETKAGTVSKGFQMLIKSPKNKDIVPFEAWSGGEAQRLRMAGTLGLSNMIQNFKGFTTNVEIYDEPTQHLSEPGVEQLLRTLHLRSLEQDKQIYIIDHRSLQFGEFNEVIRIVKDERGSHIC